MAEIKSSALTIFVCVSDQSVTVVQTPNTNDKVYYIRRDFQPCFNDNLVKTTQ